MSAAEAVASGVLGVWFALTAIIQLPSKRIKTLRRFEPTGHLLPGWNFFAPKPVAADFELYFRHVPEQAKGEEPTAWAPASDGPPNTLATVILNPRRRTRKVVFYCCQQLLEMKLNPEASDEHLTLSVPYILLLDRVSSLCPGSGAVQFRIDLVRYGEKRETKTAYVSALHAVEP